MFGPYDAKIYYDYEEWAKDAKDKRLMLVPATGSIVAQNGPNGTCKGVWFFPHYGNKNARGWLQ